MAWTTPPTFTTGDILTASDLNTLGEDMAYLKGIATAVNTPVALGAGTESFTWQYLILHKHDTLRFKYQIQSGPAGKMNLRYNGTSIGGTLSKSEGTYTHDISLAALGLTVGQPYVIQIEYEIAASSIFTLHELWEQG